MKIYIPQNIDPYNTHLKNLVDAYTEKGIEVIVGYENFITGNIVPDILHIHFLEGILKLIDYDENVFFEKLNFFKDKGVVFVYTFHDAKPHAEIRKLNYSNLFKMFIEFVDLFVHHGIKSIEILKGQFPILESKRHIVCHHGDYLNDMKNFHESQEFARKTLNLPLNKKIILIFGQLQFKNTDFAKEVHSLVRHKYKGAVLLKAGVSPVFRYNKLNKIYYKLNNGFFNIFRKNEIRIHKRFSQFETYLLFVASDVIFLPHKSGLTSGLIPMAATLCRPFVYPDIGVMEEQSEYCAAEKFKCGNIHDAFNAIDRIFNSGIKSFDNSKWLENNNWGKYVDNVLSKLLMIKSDNSTD